MLKDVWEFYSNEKDAMVELPVKIFTEKEFIPYYENLGHELHIITSPHGMPFSKYLHSPATRTRFMEWVEMCDCDILLFAVCDNEEFKEELYVGCAKCKEDGTIEYDTASFC